MIDIERIEKAYTRFKSYMDTLTFSAKEMKAEERDSYGKKISTDDKIRWEVRCNGRFISVHTEDKAEEEAISIAEDLNNCLASFLEAEYDRFMNECKSAGD